MHLLFQVFHDRLRFALPGRLASLHCAFWDLLCTKPHLDLGTLQISNPLRRILVCRNCMKTEEFHTGRVLLPFWICAHLSLQFLYFHYQVWLGGIFFMRSDLTKSFLMVFHVNFV